MVILLGHDYHADSGVWRHLSRQLPISDVHGTDINLQLPGPGLQHQLRGQPHLEHKIPRRRQEQKHQNIQTVMQQKRPLLVIGNENQQLHRIVDQYKEEIQLLIGVQIHPITPPVTQSLIPKIIQQTHIRKHHLLQEPH